MDLIALISLSLPPVGVFIDRDERERAHRHIDLLSLASRGTENLSGPWPLPRAATVYRKILAYRGTVFYGRAAKAGTVPRGSIVLRAGTG